MNSRISDEGAAVGVRTNSLEEKISSKMRSRSSQTVESAYSVMSMTSQPLDGSGEATRARWDNTALRLMAIDLALFQLGSMELTYADWWPGRVLTRSTVQTLGPDVRFVVCPPCVDGFTTEADACCEKKDGQAVRGKFSVGVKRAEVDLRHLRCQPAGPAWAAGAPAMACL